MRDIKKEESIWDMKGEENNSKNLNSYKDKEENKAF